MPEFEPRSDFWYRREIFRYKRMIGLRKRFRKRQEARKKPKKGSLGERVGAWIFDIPMRSIEAKWFSNLPEKPEINIVWRGYKNKRHIVECYPGKSKGVNETEVAAIENAWKDYKRNPRELVDTYIYWVITNAADAGHIHDLSDATNRVVAGLFHGYKISFASGKDSPLADIHRSDPWKNLWVYGVHGSTIPNKKLWEDNRPYTEHKMGCEVVIDQPPDCPDAIRIQPRKRIKSQAPLPITGGTGATEFVFGIEAETRKKISIPIEKMRHTFGVGTTGAGKTVMMEHLMMTALGARELVEAVYYIDIGKEAEDLEHVEKAGARFARTFDQAADMVESVWDIRQERKGRKTDKRSVFLFIDEAAQIFDPDTNDKAKAVRVEKTLKRLAALGRSAKIRIITFTQKPTIDFIPSSYLDLHDGRILQRVMRMRTATDFMNVDFSWNPTRFADGEFAMLWPGWMKERYGRGFISDKMR
jgi:hypothetical protein